MALDIQDKFAIEELLRRACYNADYNPPESMRAIYTPDAVFEVPAMDISCRGIDNIIAFFTQSRVVSVGRYLDTLERTADGWRLAHRSVAIG